MHERWSPPAMKAGRAELSKSFLQNYCHNVVQGVDRLIVWLRKNT